MRIERHELERMTLESFAAKHDLVMEVHERSHRPSNARYYAHFSNAEVKDGGMLCGAFGDGRTEWDAIEDYIDKISGKLLVVGAATPQRREIIVPVLTDPGRAERCVVSE